MAEYIPSPSQWAADQVADYERSGGTKGTELRGVPVVVLTTTGRKSGAIRKSPVMRVADGEKYAAIASKGGDPHHPEWYLNIQADPEITVQDGPTIGRYRAHTASGDERATWWAKATAVWPDYDTYQTKTDRQIPVVVLEPVR